METFKKHKKGLTADQVYGELPIWKVMLRVAMPSFLVGFMNALFTFIDMILLVNLMPLTMHFSFMHLFCEQSNDIFKSLIEHISNPTLRNYLLVSQNSTTAQDFVQYIAIENGLHFYSVSGTVRVASSLISPLTYVLNSVTGMVLPGGNVLFSRAISSKNKLEQIKVWQNEFYLSLFVTFCGMVLLYTLNYAILPSMVNGTVNTNFNAHTILNKNQNHYFFVFNSNTNTQIIYLKNLGHSTYRNALNILQNVNYNHPSQFSFVNNINQNVKDMNGSVSVNNQLVSRSFLNYYETVKNYATQWAQDFVAICTAGLLVTCMLRVSINIIRSYGKTLIITITMIGTTCFNIFLDFVLIFYGQIGMEGAAVATVISWLISLTILSFYFEFLKSQNVMVVSWKYLKFNYFMFNKKIMTQIMLIAISFTAMFLSYMVVRILLIHQISYVTGELYPALGSLYFISITGAVYPIMNLFQNTISSFMMAGTSIVAYNYGVKNYKRIRIFVYETTLFVILTGLFILGLVGFCNPISDWMLELFNIHHVIGHNSLAYLYQCAREFLWISLMILPFQGIGNSGFMLFRTSKRYIAATVVSLVRGLIITIPYLYIFSAIALNGMMHINNPTMAMVDPIYNPNIWVLLWTQSAATITSNVLIFFWALEYIYYGIYKPKRTFNTWRINQFIKKQELNHLLDETKINHFSFAN